MSNLHKDVDENNKHTALGFSTAGNGDVLVKKEEGFQAFEKPQTLPPCIEVVDGSLAPPTTTVGDVYVLKDYGIDPIHSDWTDGGTGTAYGDWVQRSSVFWFPRIPTEGTTVHDNTNDKFWKYDGTDWNEVESNATHTGEVTGATALTVNKTAITNKTLVTLDALDHLLIADASDSDNLKKVSASDFGSSGKVAIYDASGKPTFYSTVILAMAAAVSGDVIQLFANLTEAVFPLILKDGVTVNGNGFTYTYTSTDAAIRSETVSTSYLKNIIVRATDSSCPRAVQAFTSGGIINISDDCFIFGAQRALEVAVGATVNGGNYISSHATLYAVDSSGNVSKLKIKSNRCGNILAGTIRDCYADAGNLGFVLSSGVVAYNLLGICAGSYGIYANAARVFNSNGFSSGNAGIYGEGGAEFQGCNAYSTGYYGWEGVTQTLTNCSSYSTVNRAFSGGGNIRKSEFTALLSQAVFLSSGFIRKSDVNCLWNNAGGHGVNLNANNLKVVGNYIQVANTSANCVTGGVFNAVLAHNEYEGATTDENANLTNIANTENTFGNIKI